jgi:histidinol-phosphate/aromatic aminotransferase/cobyric acid decarboxylase-like protein
MTEYLRVSVGNAEEMSRFMKGWKEIMSSRSAAAGS